MAGGYNVDDILEEVKRKKQSTQSAAAHREPPVARVEKKPRDTSAMFRMKGMTDEFEAAPKAAKPPKAARRPTAVVTRTDLPVGRGAAAKAAADSKTQVIPALKDPVEEGFQKRRQEKVQQFMQSPFAIDEQPEEKPEEESAASEQENEIAQYFGGLHHSKKFSKKAEEKKRSKPKSAKKAHEAERDETGDEPKKAAMVPAKKKSKKKKEDIPDISPREKKALRDEADDEGEYTRPADARDVRFDISSIRRGLARRLIATGVCTALLLYLSLCNLYPLPLLNAICPEVDMRIFLMVNLMVLVIGALAANAVIGGGLVSLFTLKADHDTPAALCVLAVIAHGVALIMNPDSISTGEGTFYFFTASAVLLANTIGKRMMIVRIEKNFAVASSDTELNGEYLLGGSKLADKLAQGQGFAEPFIAYPARVGFPEKFLKLSYSDDYSENLSRYISPIFFLFALGLGIVCRLAFKQSGIEAITVFCVVLCMASPLTPTIIGNLPLLRAAKSLTGEGAFISGYDAVETFEEMNCVAVDAKELYPAAVVEIQDFKPLSQSRIDEAILDAASLEYAANGLLKEGFLSMIGGREGILLPVEDMVYEDNGGLCAIVGGKTVLVGRRALMEKYEITAMPSPDIEKKLAKGGRKVLFVANSGEATAVMVVRYRPSQKVARWVELLGKKELSLIVSTTDPSITAKKIAVDYHYPEEFIQIIPTVLRREYAELTQRRERGKSYIMSPAGSPVRLRALAAIHSLKQSIVIGTVLQMAGLVLGYAIVAFLAFTGAMGSLGFGPLAIYQLFWAAAILLLPNLKKM